MDDSIYEPDQSQMIVNLTVTSNANDQPVTYGPVFYDVLASISSTLGGMELLIGQLVLRSRPSSYLKLNCQGCL